MDVADRFLKCNSMACLWLLFDAPAGDNCKFNNSHSRNSVIDLQIYFSKEIALYMLVDRYSVQIS